MLKNLKISQKLNILLLVISLLAGIFGFFIRELGLEKNEIFDHIRSHKEMEVSAIRLNLYYRDIIADISEVARDISLANQYISSYEAKLNTFNESFNQYKDIIVEHDERWAHKEELDTKPAPQKQALKSFSFSKGESSLEREFKELSSLHDNLSSLTKEYFGLANGDTTISSELDQKLFIAITREKRALEDLAKRQAKEQENYIAELILAEKRIDIIIVYLVIALILTISILSSLMYSKIAGSIKKLNIAAKKISAGNFSGRVNISSKDEIGELAGTFNVMAVNLEDKIIDLEKFRLAIENASDHIIITDPNGAVLYANQASVKTTGYSIGEIIGSRPSLWGGQMDEKFYQKMWKTIKINKKSFSAEIKNKRKNGIEYIAEVHIAPIIGKDKKVDFFVGIERDITEAKRIDKAKTEFVSLASHQLRTPLSSIKWQSEAVLGKIKSVNYKKYIEEIHSSNERMIKLVNALLNVSRLELGTFSVEPKLTDIIEIAENALKELKPIIESKTITIIKDFKKLSELRLDPNLARIIFQNLFSNALKYTPPKGEVKISIRRKESNLLIEVADNGYGIPKSQQSKIFTKLFRADNIKEKDTDGTGLGLYIVKSILDKTGGKIWFSSTEGKGTTFHASLPAAGMRKRNGGRKLI